MRNARAKWAKPASGGFTLIEILIVITIAGLVSAITLGGIGSIGASNRRTTCQTNMTQIYQALRLYNADYGTFPPYQPDPAVPGIAGRGLFSLYCSDTSPDSPTLQIYLKRPAALHCPEDTSQSDNFFVSGGAFNMNYISYQQRDDEIFAGDPSPSLYPSYTYQPTRESDTADGAWARQLIPWDSSATSHVPLPRPPADDSVVTWCFHHRASSGGRNYDNVLFYDGSVQLIQRLQDDPAGQSPTPFMAWQRVSRKVF